MKNQLAFICESAEHFLIRSMIADLEKSNYEVKVYPVNMNIFTFINSPYKLFMVYLDGYKEDYQKMLTSLKLLVGENNDCKLFLIGTPNDLELAYEHIPQRFVTHSFKRPVNVEDLIKIMDASTSGYTYEKNLIGVQGGYARNGRKTILIVDDDEVYLHTLERWFSGEYNVYTATSSSIAIPLLKKISVDLILLDYEMPVISGLDLFQMLKNEPSTANIPVIFLTAKDDKHTILEVIAAKPALYLLKTLPPLLLQQNVRDFFAKQGNS